MKRKHISTMLMRKCLNTIAYLQNNKPFLPEPELSDFYHPSENQKNGKTIICCSGYRHCNIYPTQIP